MAKSYVISDGYKGQIDDVILRVGNQPQGSVQRIQTRFESMPEGGGGAIRLCTFTGEWLINDGKIVKFASDTNATAAVINLLFSIGDSCTAQRAYVSVVTDPEQPADVKYHLINVEHFETPIITQISLGTASIDFTTKLAWVPYPGVTSSQFITISTATAC